MVMTKSQLADYTRREMDGAEDVRRDQGAVSLRLMTSQFQDIVNHNEK